MKRRCWRCDETYGLQDDVTHGLCMYCATYALEDLRRLVKDLHGAEIALSIAKLEYDKQRSLSASETLNKAKEDLADAHWKLYESVG